MKCTDFLPVEALAQGKPFASPDYYDGRQMYWDGMTLTNVESCEGEVATSFLFVCNTFELVESDAVKADRLELQVRVLTQANQKLQEELNQNRGRRSTLFYI